MWADSTFRVVAMSGRPDRNPRRPSAGGGRRATTPRPGGTGSDSGLGPLFDHLVAHADAFSRLGHEWRDGPGDGDSAHQRGTAAPVDGRNAPVPQVWQALLAPWVEALTGGRGVGTAEGAYRAPDSWFLDVDAVLGRAAYLARSPDTAPRLIEVRAAVEAYLRALHAYLGVWSEITKTAWQCFVARCEGAAPDTLRAAYDLWVDVSEEAYAERARTPEFAAAQGDLINAYVGLCKHDRMLRKVHSATAGVLRRTVHDDEWDASVSELRRQIAELAEAFKAVTDAAPGGCSPPRAAPPD